MLSEIDQLESSLRKSKHEGGKFGYHKFGDMIDFPSRFDGDSISSGGDFGISVQYEL